jgi:DNA-binding transcriptional ArsR family regulator
MVSQEGAVNAGLKAIADTTRRGILELLKGRRLSVLEIAEEFPVSRPAISKHLRILKEAGLVLETPSGRQRFYALERAPLEVLAAWLAGFNGNGEQRANMSRQGLPTVGRNRRRARALSLRAAEDWRVW